MKEDQVVNTIEKGEKQETWVRQVARAMEEQRESAGVEDAGTEEESKGCKEDTRDCSRI